MLFRSQSRLVTLEVDEIKNADVLGNNAVTIEGQLIGRATGGNFVGDFEQKGLAFSGQSKEGNLMEMIELKNHSWYVGCQFHPEFTSSPINGHPLFNGFINSASKRKI